MNNEKTFQLLLVEDNPGDVLLFKRGLKKASIHHQLHVITDGEKAWNYLIERHEPKHINQSMPDLIVLDINMPKIDGRELLVGIKQKTDLKHIPVLILTSSDAPTDIEFAYNHNANGYIIKPSHLEGFNNMTRSLVDFWLETNTLLNKR